MRTRPETSRQTAALFTHIWRLFSPEEVRAFAEDHWQRWSRLEIEDAWFAGKRCLDVGAGSGRAALSLIQRAAGRVVALDLARGALEQARAVLPPDPAVAIVQADALSLPFPDASFDFVHCNGVLHHTPDPARGFRECVRVLAPGGLLVIGLYGAGGLANVAIAAARLAGMFVSQKLARGLLGLVTRDPVLRYAVLDSVYVPIRRTFRRRRIERWFREAGLTEIRSLDSTWSFYRRGRFIKGDGYLLIQGRRPAQ